MNWYNYLAAFFAGAFIANTIPHFVHGISGNKFPTPFSKPRGIGLSSSTTNVVWALFNILVAYLLIKLSKITGAEPCLLLTLFLGFALASILLSIRFKQKHKE